MPAKTRGRSNTELSLIEQTIRFVNETTGAHHEEDTRTATAPHHQNYHQQRDRDSRDKDGNKKNIMWRMLHAGGSPKPTQHEHFGGMPPKFKQEIFVAKRSQNDHEPMPQSAFDISPVEESRFAKASPGRLVDWARDRDNSPHDDEPGYLRKISHWRSHSSEKAHRRKNSHLRGHSQTSVSTLSSQGHARSPPPPPLPDKDIKWKEKAGKPPALMPARSPLSPLYFQKMVLTSEYPTSSPLAPKSARNQSSERPPTRGTQHSSLSSGRASESRKRQDGRELAIKTERQGSTSTPARKSPGTPRTPRTPRSPVVTKGKIRTRSKSGRNMSSSRRPKREEDLDHRKRSKAETDLRRRKGMGVSLTEDDVERYKARGLPPLPYSAPPTKKNAHDAPEWVDETPSKPPTRPVRPPRSPGYASGNPAVVKSVPRHTQKSALKTPGGRDPLVKVKKMPRRKSIPSVIDDFRMQSVIAEDSEDILKWLESFRPVGKPKSGSMRRKPVPNSARAIIETTSPSELESASGFSSSQEASSGYSRSVSSAHSPSDSDNDRYHPATPRSGYYDSSRPGSSGSSDANNSSSFLKPMDGRSNSTRSSKARRHFSIRIPSMAELPGHELAQLSGLLPVVVSEDEGSMSPSYVRPTMDLSLLSPPPCVGSFTPSTSALSPRRTRDGRSSTASSAGDAFMYDKFPGIIANHVNVETNPSTARRAISNAMAKDNPVKQPGSGNPKNLNTKNRALLKLSAFGRSPIPFSPSIFGDLNSAKTMVDLSLNTNFEISTPVSAVPKSAMSRVDDVGKILITNEDELHEHHHEDPELTLHSPIEFLSDAVYQRPQLTLAPTFELAPVDPLPFSTPQSGGTWIGPNANPLRYSYANSDENDSDDSGSQCFDPSWEYPEYPSSDESASSSARNSNSSKSLKDQIERLLNASANGGRIERDGLEQGRPGVVRLSNQELRILAGRNSEFPGDILFGIMSDDIV